MKTNENHSQKYSINFNSTETYQSRTRRSSSLHPDPYQISSQAIDTTLAEKRIIEELGPKACVLEEPCRIHAARPGRAGDQPDWNDILR